MKSSKTWCVNAFHSLQAGNAGDTRACCMYRKQDPTDNLKLGEDPLDDHFNHKELIQLREDANNGVRNPGCVRCWEEEDAGRDSKRIRDNNKYNEEWQGLAYLELNLGNQCNLRCRTCGPHASSQWAKEAHDTVYAHVPILKYNEEIKKFNNSYDDDSLFWIDFENALPTIRRLDFYGGEPFMSKKMWKILEAAVEKGYSKNIELHYATNGSFWPAGVELFPKFKSVSVAFSIDGIGEQFEFMRYLANWETVKDNMTKARAYSALYSNISIGWCVTLSTLNIYSLPAIIEEYYKHYSDFGMYLNLVHAPKQYNISVMPDNVKTKVLDKLNAVPKNYKHAWTQLPGIIGFIENGVYDSEQWATFLKDVSVHDHYRGQHYAEVFPEFAELVGYVK